MMASRANTCFSLLAFFLLFLFSFNANFSTAGDSISSGQSLSGERTIVSKEGNFELGFFKSGNSQNYYIGIWYKKISQQTIIWVANRDKSILNTSLSELKISEDGKLVLLDQSNVPVWSSNSTPSAANSSVAVLLDNGNLVLRDRSNPSSVAWQSFDHPTDTWVPGGWVGVNKITGEHQSLSSWKNSEDPSPGPYTLTIDSDGTNQILLFWNRTQNYWQTGPWEGDHFSSITAMEMTADYFLKWRWFEDDKVRRCTYNVSSNSIMTRTVINIFGQINQLTWLEDSKQWVLHWSRPSTVCDVHHNCGMFGICHPTSSPVCTCPYGFQPASPNDWALSDYRGGCARSTNLQCLNKSSIDGQADKFLVMPNMGLPQNSLPLTAENAEVCGSVCLNNCSCTAYAYNNNCSIWVGALKNLQQLSAGTVGAGDLYIRLAASELPSSNNNSNPVLRVILIGVPAVIAILWISSWMTWRCQRKRLVKRLEENDGTLVQFQYRDLQHITKYFSEKLGRGSFGPVFKGMLPNRKAVAVKKLEGLKQGEKQFRAEVSTLGTIQHVNLVRLRGFCCNENEKLLVYDYMPNGSLETHLFQDRSKVLDWRKRYNIIIGVARGLAYLHENCRECIIHCDIKPENILLDEEFYPKVADLGMAKLIGRDMSRVLTTLRGTIGYLAPEWISGIPITAKVDVYGFGMMVFEVISGRRNTERPRNDGIGFFPVWAATKVNEGEVLPLLDERLEGAADMEQLRRASKVACWCIQDCEQDRPSMGQVVHALEGMLEVNIPPIPRSLLYLIEDYNSSVYSASHRSVSHPTCME